MYCAGAMYSYICMFCSSTYSKVPANFLNPPVMNTDPALGYYRSFDRTPTIANINEYYRQFTGKILEHGINRPNQFYWAYPFDWSLILTPIERDAWQVIRAIGSLPLYPQFPVLKYRADFANPTKKVILECDGKAYHDAARDKVRDDRLLEDGWHVYRVTGSELYKVAEIEYDINTDEPEPDSLYEHFMNSAEGVIKAIRMIYFIKPKKEYHDPVMQLMYRTLNKHRLADFDIPFLPLAD